MVGDGGGAGGVPAAGDGGNGGDGGAPARITLDEMDPSLLGDDRRDIGIEPAIERATTALAAAQWDRAVTAARAALAIDADEPAALAALARGLAGKGWFDAAHEALSQATGQAGSRAEASADLWYLQGWTSHRLGETERALGELDHAVKQRKDDPATWNLIGVVHLDRAEARDAIKALEIARSHAADSVGIAINLGSAYRRAAAEAVEASEAQELWRKAEKSYRAALAAGLGRGRGFAAAYLGLGLLYLDAEGYPDLDDVERLRRAVDNLEEIQDMDVPGVDRATVATYLGDARRLLDRARRAKDKVQVQDKAKAKARATERGAGARAGDKR
ncbi:MAG: hypothetical protein H6708_23655 [Kofleriaceae bacterium]|nr:hypothetical protein [Kofleriaceae bacterium]